MEFAASILTAIDFGFKTSKLIHTIISGVKDGPYNVQQTATAVCDLTSALEQLSKCRALDESGSETLRDQLLKCVDDLESFDGRLKSLTVEESERRCGRYWKRLKCVYNEKALDKMRAVVTGHTAALNLHLATLQSETVFEIPGQLATIDRRLVSQQTLSQVPGQLNTISQELIQQRTERRIQTTMWEEHRTTLGQVLQGVSSLQQGVDFGMNQVLAAHAAQGAETNQRLQVLEQMLKLTLEQQQPRRVAEVPNRGRVTPKPPSPGPCSVLMDSMTRLFRLVDAHHEQRSLHNSTDVIKSLIELLSYMMSGEFLQGAAAASLVDTGICERCRRNHVERLKASLFTVYGVLWSAGRTTPNHGKTKRVRSDTLTRTNNNSTIYSLGLGTLIVFSSTRFTREDLGDASSSHSWPPSESREVTTRISFIPSQQQPLKQILRLTTRQSFKDDGFFSSIPILEVNRVLPAESLVFTVVKNGRLDDFIALLRDGDASVRDHDEYGSSLLHYANMQPAMCQYLIRSGVDIDAVGNNAISYGFGEPGYMCTPMHPPIYDTDAAGQELERMLACRKYLLDAGADDETIPMAWNALEENGLVALSFIEGVTESMKLIFDEIGFSSCLRVLGTDPLLLACGNSGWGLEGIKLLLQRGASVHSRDPFGNTCLHIWHTSPIQALSNNGAGNVRDSMIYLIQQGAEVLAKNHDGKSVSDVAYTTIKTDPIFENRFREELWDCALANCGYNLGEFKRHRRPRVFSRPCRFISHHFEDLWAGCERLRPDYDNEKSAIYFNGPDEATGDDDEDSQLDGSEVSDSSGSDKIDDDDDENSELEEDRRSGCFGDFEGHSTRCCPPYLRVRPSTGVYT